MLPRLDFTQEVLLPVVTKYWYAPDLSDDYNQFNLRSRAQEYVNIDWVNRKVSVEQGMPSQEEVASELQPLLDEWVKTRRLELVGIVEQAVTQMDKWQVSPKKIGLPTEWQRLAGSEFLGLVVYTVPRHEDARIETSPKDGRFVML